MAAGLRERKKARIRDQIVETTIDLIRERGYSATTVDEITRRVEITTPTFYNYFAGKEGVLGHYYVQHLGSWTTIVDEQMDSNEPAASKLSALVSNMAKGICGDAELWRAIILHGDINPAINVSQREAEREVEGSMQSIVEDAQRGGEFRSDYPADLLQAVYDGACYSIIYGWAAGEVSDDELELALLAALDVCLTGMNAKCSDRKS